MAAADPDAHRTTQPENPKSPATTWSKRKASAGACRFAENKTAPWRTEGAAARQLSTGTGQKRCSFQGRPGVDACSCLASDAVRSKCAFTPLIPNELVPARAPAGAAAEGAGWRGTNARPWPSPARAVETYGFMERRHSTGGASCAALAAVASNTPVAPAVPSVWP